MSIWLKANKLSLNLTKTKWTLFHLQKKKRESDLAILYIDNFETVRESVNYRYFHLRKLHMEIPYKTCL